MLAESLPWPPLKGGDLRNWQNLHALSATTCVGVFGLCSNDSRRGAPPELPLAFWTASTDPALASPPPKGVRLTGRGWLLDPHGHPSDLFHSQAAASELARLLAEFRPDVVLVEGLWMHGYFDAIRAAGCRVILDCHNVETVLVRELGRATEGNDLESRVVRDVLPGRTEAIERAAVREADQLWVCSANDEAVLRDLYEPRSPVVVIPNAIRMEDYGGARRAGVSPADGPLTLVYPGIYSYRPNAFAARFLIDEVLPRLADACDVPCRLQLVGPMPTPEMQAAAARDPRIEVTGPVRDVRPFLADATVMPVALFQGSGTRFKVLEAFAARLPVVSTSKGAEGLGARDGEHLLVAETAGAFVEAVLALWRDRPYADRLAARAWTLTTERFSWDAVGPRIRAAIDRVAGAGAAA